MELPRCPRPCGCLRIGRQNGGASARIPADAGKQMRLLGLVLFLALAPAWAHREGATAEQHLEALYQFGLNLQLSCSDDMRHSIVEHAHLPQVPADAHSEDAPPPDQWIRRQCLASMARRHLLLQAPSFTPSRAQLQAHLQQHSARFASPPSFDFEQLYFRNSRPARPDIIRLNRGEKLASAPHPLGRRFLRLSSVDIEARFGPAFATAVVSQSVDLWGEPVRSPLGWHLVRVKQKHPARSQDWSALRPAVLEHWRSVQRERWLQDKIRALAAGR